MLNNPQDLDYLIESTDMIDNIQNLLEVRSPNLFNKLLQPALEKVLEQERQLSHHHNQTFDYAMFFRILIYYFTTDIKSLRLFINTILNKGLLSPALELTPVPYTTFGEAFERFEVSLFQEVFEHLAAGLKKGRVNEFTIYNWQLLPLLVLGK